MSTLLLSIIFFASFNFVVSTNLNYEKEGAVEVRYGSAYSVWSDEFPFFGYFIPFRGHNFVPICSGSIIHARWVLTSARCIYNMSSLLNTYVFATEVFSIIHKKENYYEHYYPDAFFPHEEFKVVEGKGIGQHSVHDIGLTRLNKALIFSHLQPIELARDNTELYYSQIGAFIEWPDYPLDKENWGMSVNAAELRILSDFECRALALNMIIRNDLHVCGFDNRENVRACHPDSGSPFVFNRTLIGVATVTMPECFHESGPIIFTRVSAHVSWINKKMEGYNECV